MATSFTSRVNTQDFNTFHSIDRKLFAILAINLWRDPLESYHVMAFWIWLERIGFTNTVQKILALPLILISKLADEAVIGLNCVMNKNANFAFPSVHNDIPLTRSLSEKEISLWFLHANRFIGHEGMLKVIKEVCIRALTDIMKFAIRRNAAQVNMTVQPWWAVDRTLFLTFSKGYPVFEWEIREYFTRFYGDCVEFVKMQENDLSCQSIYARIVFKSVAIRQMVLNNASMDASGKVKLSINGKHVWARKYIPKRLRMSQPSSPQPRS